MSECQCRVRLDLGRLTDALNDAAPDYGSECCECGSWATPWIECPVHWALAVLEQQESAARQRLEPSDNDNDAHRLARDLAEALRSLHAEVEMGEAVGICLPDRVPSLRAGTLLDRHQDYLSMGGEE